MKMYSLIKSISFILYLSILIGCAHASRVSVEYQDPKFDFIEINKNAKIETYIVDNIDKRKYNNAFNSKFKTNGKFISYVKEQITDTLQFLLGSKANAGINQSIGATLSSFSFNPQLFNDNQAIFDSSESDFFLVVRSIVIDQENPESPSYENSSLYGAPSSGSSHSEILIVLMNIDIWSVSKKRKVLVYSSIGKCDVNFLSAETALNKAIKRSIYNMVNYINTGPYKDKF